MLWAYARRHGLVSITDMVAHRFGRPWLGAAVAVLATVFLLPYIQLQITGMGVVVSTISYGADQPQLGLFLGFAVTTGFVVVSGLRGSAWVSVLKDILVIGTLAFLAVYVPAALLRRLRGPLPTGSSREKPQWLTFPGHAARRSGPGAGSSPPRSLNSLTVVIFPTTVAGLPRRPQRRRAAPQRHVAARFYNVLLFVPMLLGMAALFVVPGLVGADSNLALFKLVVDSLPGVGRRGDRGRRRALLHRADGRVHAGHRDDVGAAACSSLRAPAGAPRSGRSSRRSGVVVVAGGARARC